MCALNTFACPNATRSGPLSQRERVRVREKTPVVRTGPANGRCPLNGPFAGNWNSLRSAAFALPV